MTTILQNMIGDLFGFFRARFAAGGFNPNTVADTGGWDSSFETEEVATSSKLPALRSSDRTLPLASRLQALEVELAAFDKALPYIDSRPIIETDSIV